MLQVPPPRRIRMHTPSRPVTLVSGLGSASWRLNHRTTNRLQDKFALSTIRLTARQDLPALGRRHGGRSLREREHMFGFELLRRLVRIVQGNAQNTWAGGQDQGARPRLLVQAAPHRGSDRGHATDGLSRGQHARPGNHVKTLRIALRGKAGEC